ncbi:MAG: branched chain amino acid aminotransferase [Chloroflexi bacterium]|nr:branched chain amino acid aminotransferase [Chloroflexota bacterium]OUW95863.1 MAG: branched chain amino acid aminotransferase [Chloroflexi bacterium TMED230]RZP13785.1 MAG: branched-chain amino acid transaminase [Chloroflexota bacterium]
MAFHQGNKILLKDAKVGVMTHALHYGTAAFEGIRGNWNSDKNEMVIFRLQEHYERLLRGANILRMNLPYSAEDLSEITVDLVKSNGYKEDVYIRPLAYKSHELVANLKLHELDDDITIIVIPFGAYIDNDKPINCQTSSWRRPEDTMMPTGVKLSGLYTTSILAKTEAVSANFDEAILLNFDGTVSEGSGENLFMIKNNEIITPTETDNCLLGITRDSIIEIAQKELGLKVNERKIHRSELYLADEVFLTGTAAHVTSVGTLDSRKIGNGNIGSITKNLQELYFSIVIGNDSIKKKSDYTKWLTSFNV